MKRQDTERSKRVEVAGGLVGRLVKFKWYASDNWYISYWWAGRERRESTGTTDFKAAKKALKRKLEHLQAAKRGSEPFLDPKSKRLTVAELLDALDKDYTLRDVKSLKQAQSHLKAVKAAFGVHRALALTPEVVDQQIEAWRAEGQADATINRRVQLLGQAFRLAHERKRIPAVPRFRHLREQNARQGFVTPEQFEAIVARLPEPYADYARLAYMTGWRKGEVRALTAANVDLRAGELRIGDSKNSEGRVLPLKDDDGSLNAVGQIVQRRMAARRIGEEVVPWLFHCGGQPVGDFRKAWASACTAAGFVRPKLDKQGRPVLDRQGQPVAVAAFLFHDLRRSFAKDAVDAGNDYKTVMDLGGWKTVATFHRYKIVDTRQMAKALRRLEDARKAPAGANVIVLRAATEGRPR